MSPTRSPLSHPGGAYLIKDERCTSLTYVLTEERCKMTLPLTDYLGTNRKVLSQGILM